MMKLEGLAAFTAVADAGSISEAARRLGVPKSVVSERLSELERELGGRLAQRTTRRMSLTEDGHAFLPRARRILQEAQDGRDEFAERRGELTGPLRLSAPVEPRSLEALEGHRAILYSHRETDWRFQAAGRRARGPRDRGLRVNNGMFIRDAVLAGLGIALVPSFIVPQELRAGGANLVIRRGGT
jgi:DNA-binding transcriptional LysR family regulator